MARCLSKPPARPRVVPRLEKKIEGEDSGTTGKEDVHFEESDSMIGLSFEF